MTPIYDLISNLNDPTYDLSSYGKGLFSMTGVLYIGVTALQFYDWFQHSESEQKSTISKENIGVASNIAPPTNSMVSPRDSYL